MKPELPKEIQKLFPVEIIQHIRSFVPHTPKKTPLSPSLLRELDRIQRSPLRGKNEMYLRTFDDFILE